MEYFMGLKFSPAGARKLDSIIADGAEKSKRRAIFKSAAMA